MKKNFAAEMKVYIFESFIQHGKNQVGIYKINQGGNMGKKVSCSWECLLKYFF